ncbi:MAG: hypothetical protein ABIR79_05210, partial [Candidatus Binatia bacterium]
MTTAPWDAPDPIELACKAAVTHAFCTQSEIDERAAMAKLATLAPAAAGSERWLGDPVVRRVAAFVYGTAQVEPARYGLLRGYVQLVRETRYLVGLARTLVADGVPVACTEQLLRDLRIVWAAQDRKIAGDPRPLDVVCTDVAREEETEFTTSAEGRRTVQRVRTSFGAVLSCVALDRPGGSRREEYTWNVPSDLELDEWRVAIDQATVRQMHLWNQQRRIDDLYFVVTGPVVRVRSIEWRGALVEERQLNAIPNYEPLIASD